MYLRDLITLINSNNQVEIRIKSADKIRTVYKGNKAFIPRECDWKIREISVFNDNIEIVVE